MDRQAAIDHLASLIADEWDINEHEALTDQTGATGDEAYAALTALIDELRAAAA